MKRLGDRVVELERMVKSSRLYLEDIAHKLNKTGNLGLLLSDSQYICFLSFSLLVRQNITNKSI